MLSSGGQPSGQVPTAAFLWMSMAEDGGGAVLRDCNFASGQRRTGGRGQRSVPPLLGMGRQASLRLLLSLYIESGKAVGADLPDLGSKRKGWKWTDLHDGLMQGGN